MQELKNIISDLEYAAFNLFDKQDKDLPSNIIESTGADDTLLLAIRKLKNINIPLEQQVGQGSEVKRTVLLAEADKALCKMYNLTLEMLPNDVVIDTIKKVFKEYGDFAKANLSKQSA